jgi:hypothetical protein
MYFLCVINKYVIRNNIADYALWLSFILLQYKKRQSFNCLFLLYCKSVSTYVY